MNQYFCTHFNYNYISFAKSLAGSLELHYPEGKIFMICMDNDSYIEMKKFNLKNIIVINHELVENFITNLKIAKSNRSEVEYFFTFSPAICFYVLKNFDFVKQITYLDSDLYFFSSPLPIFNEINNSSIAIIEHRYNFLSKRYLKYGKYNVGWVTFKNDFEGLSCLYEWLENCIDWCYQRLENNKYADQKYLDFWPNKYLNLCIINNIGANLAPWNISNYKILLINNQLYINNDKLIFYHFSGIKQVSKNKYYTGLSNGLIFNKGLIRNNIYKPYLKILNFHNSSIIISKKNIHLSSFGNIIRNVLRKILSFIFCDIIEIKT
jgi:hypothetical protein